MYPHGIPRGDNSRDISYMSHHAGMESPTVYGSNSTFLWDAIIQGSKHLMRMVKKQVSNTLKDLVGHTNLWGWDFKTAIRWNRISAIDASQFNAWRVARQQFHIMGDTWRYDDTDSIIYIFSHDTSWINPRKNNIVRPKFRSKMDGVNAILQVTYAYART